MQFEVVTFRGQRVAVPLGEPLGKQLYACAALDALFKSSRGCDGVACSVMVELGGVGLCAFGLLKEPHHAGRAFHVQAQWRRLANISHVMAGNPANVILPGSGIPWPAGGPGPSLHQAAARLVGALTPVAGAAAATDVVVKVDMCVGCHSWLHTLLPVLATKRVGAVVLMFPERLTEGLLTEANSLVATAAMFGLKAFLGGFDGPPYHDRFHDPAASTAAPGPSGVFIARERAPPPTLHAFTPLHVADQSRHQALVNLLCHYLLDTAASSNFTVGRGLQRAIKEHNDVKAAWAQLHGCNWMNVSQGHGSGLCTMPASRPPHSAHAKSMCASGVAPRRCTWRACVWARAA